MMFHSPEDIPITFDLFDEDLPKELIPVLDHQEYQINVHQLTPTGPPSRKVFPGKYNFAVEIDGSHTQKKKYLYSHRLNRIYVNMDCNFSVTFKWDKVSDDEYLYVRATTVFSELSQAQKRVERCIQHSHESFNSSLNPLTDQHVIKNVLRSARAPSVPGVPYCGSADVPDVHYCGRADVPDSWLSVLVRLTSPQPHAFHFVCKNSCSSGINRRPIDIIFTLESMAGEVLGRQSVGARVCSCPKRDLLSDEKKPPPGKRPLSPPAPAPAPPLPPATPAVRANTGPPPTKRRLRDVTDEDVVVNLPAMQVYGSRTALTGLTVMINMMKQTRDAKVNNTDLRNCINELENLVEREEFQIANVRDKTT